LECHSALSASFWTLTYADDAIPPTGDKVKRQVKTFFELLRRHERQHGNNAPIRYFGCIELGGLLQRPHFHFLIYNLVASYRTPEVYRHGLPRIRWAIDQWPHGHIDIAEVNPSTVSYVSKYLSKPNQDVPKMYPGLRPRFSSTKPTIGSYGIYRLGQKAATKVSQLYDAPGYILFGEKKKPLTQTLRQRFLDGYLSGSGTLLRQHPYHRKQRLDYFREKNKLRPDQYERYANEMETRIKEEERQEEARQAQATAAIQKAITTAYLKHASELRSHRNPTDYRRSEAPVQIPSPTGFTQTPRTKMVER